jgi:hypothetical protein
MVGNTAIYMENIGKVSYGTGVFLAPMTTTRPRRRSRESCRRKARFKNVTYKIVS